MYNKRILPASLFIVLGSGMLFYGICVHVIPIGVEQEREITVTVPAFGEAAELPLPGTATAAASEEPPPETTTAADDNPFASPATNGGDEANPFETSAAAAASDESDNPFESPPVAPELFGSVRKTITEKYIQEREEPERAVVRDITVGGIARLANGQLQRTYSGKTPALCPS